MAVKAEKGHGAKVINTNACGITSAPFPGDLPALKYKTA